MFHVSLLEWTTNKNRRVDKNTTKLKFDAGYKKVYEANLVTAAFFY